MSILGGYLSMMKQICPKKFGLYILSAKIEKRWPCKKTTGELHFWNNKELTNVRMGARSLGASDSFSKNNK